MTNFKERLMRQTALTAGALAISASGALADQVFNDDVIVDGSLCVGQDCVNGESFGFDTIRMKENNLRITATDTSNSASFPTNDWTLVFNDSSNGGANKFSVQDITAGGRLPFQIFAGAPSNSLMVNSSGRVGIGTGSPVVRIHAKDGNTPTLRLEQDGSSGFTAQTFDIASNESNFFVRDATNGSTLPFRIEPNTGSNTLYLDSDEEVGINTTAPAATLHVQEAAGSATDVLRLQNNEGVVLRMVDTAADGEEWTFQSNNGEFRVANPSAAGTEMFMDINGNMTIRGSITTNGSCSVGCDRVFDEDYELRSMEEHASYMWANKHLPGVGATAEEGPMNLSDKVGGILNELEHAHIYIGQLHERLEALEARLESLDEG